MRGHDEQTTHMFSYLSPEQRVPADHPLRAVRALTDEALQTMSRRFASLYAMYRHGFLGQPGECIHAAVVSATARRTTAGARKPSRSINHCWL